MQLSANSIRRIRPVEPFCERTIVRGKSYGLSLAGYDVRIAQHLWLDPKRFGLASTMEKFTIPLDICALVKDKSTWARYGLSVFNTVIEPGWTGFLTLELVNNSAKLIEICKGDPIAQILFYRLDEATEGYSGKYQNQAHGPQKPIEEI